MTINIEMLQGAMLGNSREDISFCDDFDFQILALMIRDSPGFFYELDIDTL